MSAVHLSRSTVEEIHTHCQDDYPAECCGIIASGAGGHSVHRCRNIQDELHKRDPETHSRTARTAYRMDDLEVARILQQVEAEGGGLAAFYHSHIDCDAYFSEEDKAAAMFLDEPAYPGVSYIVVSVIDGEVRGHAAFRWVPQARAFDGVALRVED